MENVLYTVKSVQFNFVFKYHVRTWIFHSVTNCVSQWNINLFTCVSSNLIILFLMEIMNENCFLKPLLRLNLINFFNCNLLDILLKCWLEWVIRNLILDSRHGEPWREFRTKVQKPCLQLQTVRKYIKPIEEVTEYFIQRWVCKL